MNSKSPGHSRSPKGEDSGDHETGRIPGCAERDQVVRADDGPNESRSSSVRPHDEPTSLFLDQESGVACVRLHRTNAPDKNFAEWCAPGHHEAPPLCGHRIVEPPTINLKGGPWIHPRLGGITRHAPADY